METLLAECLDATHVVQVTHDQVSIIQDTAQGGKYTRVWTNRLAYHESVGIQKATWRPTETDKDCQITLACTCASGMAVCLAGTETNRIVLLEFGYTDTSVHVQPQLDTALPLADFNEPTCMCFLRQEKKKKKKVRIL